MNRPAKIVCFSLLLLPAVAISAPGTNASANNSAQNNGSVIYKHVDENGRVTYANSPIKGGARVDLEPLTVIPSTPSGSLNPANAQAVVALQPQRANAPAAAPALTPAVAIAKPPVQVATVLPVSAAATQAAFTRPSVPAPDNNIVASLEAMNQLTQQRQAETRRRLLEGELQTEEKLLVAAKAQLDEEQKLSSSIRAMRASFAATSEAVTAQKPLVSPETRAEIERHFERVRNLQDQVAMHENQMQALRERMVALK